MQTLQMHIYTYIHTHTHFTHITHIIIAAFLYCGCNGNKHNDNVIGEKYGMPWGKNGDIVECVLNLKTMEVSYTVNDKKQGIAFILNNQKTYHFVLSFAFQKDSITVISETIETTPKNAKEISMPCFVNFCFVFVYFFCLYTMQNQMAISPYFFFCLIKFVCCQ